jgi:polysaccharide biosynthesis transport protein
MQPSPGPWLPSDSADSREFYRLESKVNGLLAAFDTPAPPAGLLSYWRTLRSRLPLLVAVALIPAAAGWFLAFHEQKIYQARSTLELLEPGRTLNMRNLSSDNHMFGGDVYVETQVAKMRSDSLLEAVRRRLAQEGAVPPGSALDSGREAALASMRTNLDVWPIRGTSLVGVTYTAPDPDFAARFVNALSDEYIHSDVEARAGNAEQTRAWLGRELEDAKVKLESSEARLQSYANSSGLLFTSPKGNAGEEAEVKLQFIAQELADSQAKLATLQARYEVAVARPADAPVGAEASDVLRGIQSRLLDLNRERASLASQFTPEYYKLQQVNAEIAALEGSEARERAHWIGQLRQEYQTEQQHEALVEAAYRKQASLVSDQAAKSIHYNVLKREVETNRDLYDALLGGMKEAGVNAAARVQNARVVDSAAAPHRPYRPNPARNSAIGLLSGLMMGAAYILTRDATDRRLRGPGTTSSCLNVPELGVIPSAKPHLLPTARREFVVTGRYPRKAAPVADAFHSAVTSIFMPGRHAHPPQVVVVTSAAAHEGKSTVAGNLGLMAAQTGKRVVLVDGDLRNPRLHRIYSLPERPGLKDLLLQPGPLAPGQAAEMACPTGLDGLFLLPGGTAGGPLLPLLHSARMSEMVAQLRGAFDLILIDTPPVLQFADARLFGRLSDALILVVRSGHTSRSLALAAKARLMEDGLPIAGTILNDWNAREAGYEYSDAAYRS